MWTRFEAFSFVAFYIYKCENRSFRVDEQRVAGLSSLLFPLFDFNFVTFRRYG